MALRHSRRRPAPSPSSARTASTNAIGRREALRRIGAVAGAAAAAPLMKACGDASASQITPQQLGLETLVVVMMENRSFDHFLGSLSLVEGRKVDGLRSGFENPMPDGTAVPIYREEARCVADPPHGFDSSRRQVNGGAMDGFVRENFARNGAADAASVVGYHVRSQLPLTYGLTDEFVTCERWFCSVLGPTWPNRMYLHSAQSSGRKNNDFPEDPAGFQWTTIYDVLDASGVDWRYYYTDLPFLFLWGSLRRQAARKFAPIEQFYEDARAGTLPPVVVVDPGFQLNDDHPPHDIRLGQAFLSSVLHGLGRGPQWTRSLLVLTYDEHGGFFDHVPPPTVEDERAAEGFDQLGVRVPSLVVSPWAKRGFVSKTLYEHSSWPALLEWQFGLEPLTVRDAKANVFLDAIDVDRVRRRDPRPFPSLPVVEVDPEVPAECLGAEGQGAAQLAAFADAGGIPAGLDRRPQLEKTMRAIADELVRTGAGRLRR